MVCNSDSFYMHYIMSAENCYRAIDASSKKSEKLQKMFEALDFLDLAEKEGISKSITKPLRKKYILKGSEICVLPK